MTFDVRACGARIRELRMKNGLTQETLAEDLNITDVHLRRIESGVRGGSIELLIELALFSCFAGLSDPRQRRTDRRSKRGAEPDQ